MLKKILSHARRQPIAIVALFVALGGTSYAAATLPKDSVDSKQIQKGAVKSPEVADGSLKAKDFKAGSLPQGEQGPQGIQGIQGPPGADGDSTAAAARLLRGTATLQAVADATPNVGLLFPNTEYNNENLFTTGTDGTSGATTLIIPEAGVYSVSAEVIWVDPAASPANTDNGTGTRSLFLNGPQPGGVRAGSTVRAVSGVATRQVLATTEKFAAGDAIFLTAQQDSGTSLNIRGSQNQVHFSATKLSD
ncbi:MAG: hypothetical protein U0R24_12265 [Solirubrobacterales bacterium]